MNQGKISQDARRAYHVIPTSTTWAMGDLTWGEQTDPFGTGEGLHARVESRQLHGELDDEVEGREKLGHVVLEGEDGGGARKRRMQSGVCPAIYRGTRLEKPGGRMALVNR